MDKFVNLDNPGIYLNVSHIVRFYWKNEYLWIQTTEELLQISDPFKVQLQSLLYDLQLPCEFPLTRRDPFGNTERI